MNIFKNKKSIKKIQVKEIQSKSKDKKSKVKGPSKLKKDTGIKVVRILIWLVIAVVCIRGVLTIVKPDPVNMIKKNNEEFKAQLSKDNQIESRTFSFAESFIREYFTLYSGKKDDYQNRLSKYINKSKIETVDVKGNMSVDSVQAYNLERYSENQLDVYVYAKVQVRTEKAGQEMIADPNLKQYDVSLEDMYVKVPIYYTNTGEMIVENLPMFVGAPKLANQKLNTDSIGKGAASNAVTSEVKDSLNQFFKAYYQEDQTQVDYFLSKPGKISAVGGNQQFKGIDKNMVYDIGNDRYKAVVEFTIVMDGKIINQSANVTLVYKDDKYLVENIDERVINFK